MNHSDGTLVQQWEARTVDDETVNQTQILCHLSYIYWFLSSIKPSYKVMSIGLQDNTDFNWHISGGGGEVLETFDQ